MAPSTAGPTCSAIRGEIERDFGAAELEQVLDRGAGGAAQRVGLDLVLFAQADDERALVFVAQQNGAARRRRRIPRPARRRAGGCP